MGSSPGTLGMEAGGLQRGELLDVLSFHVC